MYRIREQIILFLMILLISASSCGNRENTDSNTQVPVLTRDTIEKYNRESARSEDREIDDFIARYSWEMKKTSTGLRYMIYRKGSGEQAVTGKTVTLQYNLKLLNGNLIYNSASDGLKKFKIGQGGVESGLEEGILYLRVGDKAKFIVPSHLAFGLLGDQNKIPPGATLVYDVELLNLK